ncbi:protein FAM229A [Pezoporus flaviventris]|uniref:protein FAM229A n=1 Tax=Pezoporus flaviventris TaxID=889875 RepID=UPI002AB2A1C8|nr:protein FAM229A [Pezoporus flaviventris]
MLRGSQGSHCSFLSPRCTQGPAMSSQRALQARRFPIEAGDCPSSEVPPEVQEAPGQELAVGRQLRRCPGSHCLTLPNVPIDVFIATGGSGRPRTS